LASDSLPISAPTYRSMSPPSVPCVPSILVISTRLSQRPDWQTVATGNLDDNVFDRHEVLRSPGRFSFLSFRTGFMTSSTSTISYVAGSLWPVWSVGFGLVPPTLRLHSADSSSSKGRHSS